MRRALLMFILLLCPALVSAATYHTAKTGSAGVSCASAQNWTTGTQNQAKLTIAQGLSCLAGGDTLIIHAGTYAENIPNTIPSGSSGSPTILQRYQNDAVIIRPSSNPSTTAVIGLVGKSYLTFDGLIVDGNNKIVTYGLRIEVASHDIIFKNGDLRFNSFVGTQISDDSHHITFQNNQIHDNGVSPQFDHGVYDGASYNVYDGNRIFNNSGFGLHFFKETNPSTLHDHVIKNNLIFNNNGLGNVILGGGPHVFYNNVIYNSTGAGLNLQYSNANNIQVYGNTIYNSCGSFYGLYAEGTGHTVRNNLVYCPAGGTTLQNSASASTFSNNLTNLTSDPGFISAAGGNFHINVENSPAVNTGFTLPSPYNEDLEGVPRPAGQFTIGAYQFVSEAPPPVPPPAGLQVFLKGNTANDSSSNGRNATLLGGTLTTGTPIIAGDTTFLFDGLDDYATLAENIAFRPTDKLCLSLWLNSTNANDAYPWDVGGSYGLWHDAAGNLHGYIVSGGSLTSVRTSGISGVNGVNAHVVYTKDALGLRLYLNGNQAAFTPTTAAISYTGTPQPVIGRNGSQSQEFFGGRLAYLRFYNDECTAAAVLNLYQEGSAIPTAGVSIAHTAWYATGTPGVQLGTTDADLPLHPLGVPLALRFGLRKSAAGTSTEYYRPVCITDTGAGFPAWTSALELTNSLGSLGVRYYADTAVTQGQSIAALLPADGFSAVNGKILRSPIDTTSPYDSVQQVSLSEGQHIEQQIQLEFGAPLVAGNRVQCRLVRESGADLDGYTHIQTVTLGTPGPSLLLGVQATGGTW